MACLREKSSTTWPHWAADTLDVGDLLSIPDVDSVVVPVSFFVLPVSGFSNGSYCSYVEEHSLRPFVELHGRGRSRIERRGGFGCMADLRWRELSRFAVVVVVV